MNNNSNRRSHSLILGFLLSLGLGLPARANVDAYFTSMNHGSERSVCADTIIDAMRRASKRIDVAVAHFNSDRIAKALIALHKERNGNADPADDLEIRVLVDLGEYSDKKSRATDLEAGGLTVRYKIYSLAFSHAFSALMHHKFMIIDDKELLTGSYNWSDTAEYTNYENLLHYHKRGVKTVIADFQGEFNKLWGLGRDQFKPFVDALSARPGDPKYRALVPVHFDSPYFGTPMTLNRDEFKDIRSQLFKIGFYGARNASGSRYFNRETKSPQSEAPEGEFVTPPPSPWVAGSPAGASAEPESTSGSSSRGAAGGVADANRDNAETPAPGPTPETSPGGTSRETSGE